MRPIHQNGIGSCDVLIAQLIAVKAGCVLSGNTCTSQLMVLHDCIWPKQHTVPLRSHVIVIVFAAASDPEADTNTFLLAWPPGARVQCQQLQFA